MNLAALQLMTALVLAASQDCDPWITRAEYDGLSIVVAGTASPSEHYGAEQFKAHWFQCTGFDAPIEETPHNQIAVWIGHDGLPKDLQTTLNLGGLGPDGLCIKTVGSNLILAGGRQRGTMYAVFEFFQRYMGVRWLAPDFTHIPPPPESLPNIDFRYVPPFEWRDINYRAFRDPHFAAVHRINGQFPDLPASMGGHIAFANGFAHTFHSFVSPGEYGKAHPEYFSEVNSERRIDPSSTQLCLTNPDVLRIVTDKTRDILRKSKSERPIVCITQMDTGFWCECANCAAIDKQEDSQSGSVLWFVNQVADAIREEFPAAYVDTFAYTYTRKPPKHIRPHDNVIVRLCSIECNFSRPHADPHSAQNHAFQEDIKRWSQITKNLYIWDYTQNWHCHQQPHPNFHVLQPNIHFFAEHGVRGLFEQASPSSPHSDFEYLKAYILARAMWDPNVDWRALMSEFIACYYEKAGPYIHQYIDLVTKKVLNDDYYLSFNSRLEWMDYDTVLEAEAIFRRAFAATQDPVIIERLRSVYLSVQYAALVCIPRIESDGDAWVLTRPPSLTFDEYWNLIGKMGVTMLGDEPIGKLQERLQGLTPPRHQELTIEKLDNERYEVWVVPEVCGAIVRFRDKQADMDLFRGEEAILNNRWRWQDWEVMDPQSPRIEEGISGPYTLVERTSERIALEKSLKNGLTIRRSMTLKPGSEALETSFTVINRGTHPVVPLVKPHPEFWLQGPYTPEIWVERTDGWKKQRLNFMGSMDSGAGSIDPAGVTRWAARIPHKRLTIVSTVPSENVEKLFYYFNLPYEHVNLEMVPVLTPLEPGASRTMNAEYTLSRKTPKAKRNR
jgi:hypothetical protein